MGSTRPSSGCGRRSGNPRRIPDSSKRWRGAAIAFARTSKRPPPPDPAPLSDRYRLHEQIGAGDMGIVYRAEDLRLGRPVALKVLPREFAQRLRRAAPLSPRGARGLGADAPEHLTSTSRSMAVSQRSSWNCSKARRSKRCSPVDPCPSRALSASPFRSFRRWKLRTARVSSHRDLKPANVLVTPHGVKVLDFGLATIDRATGLETHVTERGTILGTLHYMSPEQAQGKDAGTASDIFSFGILLYEMVAGQRPFEGENSATVMASILKSEPAPLPASSPVAYRRALPGEGPGPTLAIRRRSEGRTPVDRRALYAHPGATYPYPTTWTSCRVRGRRLRRLARDPAGALPRAVVRKANDPAGRCRSPQRLARRIAHRLPLRRTPVYPRHRRRNSAPRRRFRGRRDEYPVLVPGRRLAGVHFDGEALAIVSARAALRASLGTSARRCQAPGS